MTLHWSRQLGALASALLLWLLTSGVQPTTVAAQGFDPASTVGAYAAALNTHDLAAGLALFDKNGSATDEVGHHFEGRTELTVFLLESGFASPDARITTDHLRVIGNRALWTYTCSCSTGTSEVRVVVNQDKITVFFMSRPSASSLAAARAALGSQPDSGTPRVLVELGLAIGIAAVMFGLRRRRPHPPPLRRPSQGMLLATLAQSRGLSIGEHNHRTAASRDE